MIRQDSKTGRCGGNRFPDGERDLGRPGRRDIPYGSYKQKRLKTPSGRFEFEPSLPTYSPIPHHQQLGGGQFHLITFQWNVHSYSQTANCKWLTGDRPQESPLDQRGKRSKDESDHWRSRQDHLCPGFPGDSDLHHPGDSSRGWWPYPTTWDVGIMGESRRANRFKARIRRPVSSGGGSTERAFIQTLSFPIQQDPLGEGQGWMDTVIKIEKV